MDTSRISIFKTGLQLWLVLQLYGWIDRFEIEV